MEYTDEIENLEGILRLMGNIGIWHDFGWYGLTLPIMDEICRYNKENPNDKISITQIKQKWGRLEIYTSKRPGYLDKMIIRAGLESQHICEICGVKGKLRDMYGCFKTLCVEHYQAMMKAMNNDKSERQLFRELLDIKHYDNNSHKLEVRNEE